MATAPVPIDDIRWRRWEERRWAGRLLRLAIVAVPILAGLAAGLTFRAVVSPGSGVGPRLAWLAGFAVTTAIGFVVAGRLMRRFAPLAALLRMSLLFPDRLPSRFGVALRAGSSASLSRRLAADELEGAGDAEVAEAVLAHALALNRHDRLTRGHGERVRSYAEIIGQEMGLTEHDLDRLRWAGLLHDVGKLAVPPDVLNKPGPLSPEEIELVRTHAAEGAAMVEPMRGWLGEWVDAVGQHHERWDGQGYPMGLAADEISLGARIVAVADVFDVMTSVRSYRKPVSADEAREEIVRCSGSQFDPAVVSAFVRAGLTTPWRAAGPLLALLSLPFARQVFSGSGSTGSATTTGVVVGSVASALGLVLVPPEPEPEPEPEPPAEIAAPAPTTTTSTTTTTSAAPRAAPQPPPPTTTSTTTTTTSAPPVVPPPTTTTTTTPPTTTTTTTPTTAPPPTVPPPTLTVAPPPVTAAPIDVADVSVVGDEDVAVTVPIGLGDDVVLSIVEGPATGTASLDDAGVLTFVPEPDASGQETVVVEACRADDCRRFAVRIDVAPAPDAPDVVDDVGSGRSGLPVVVDVLANDTDRDGDPLTVRLVEPVPAGVTTDGSTVTVVGEIGVSAVVEAVYEAVDPTGLATAGRVVVTTEAGAVIATTLGPDRSGRVALDGTIVTGDELFVEVVVEDAQTVLFFIDDPDRVGAPVVTEQNPPFDLGTTDPSSGLARPFDVSGLAEGPHLLTVVVRSMGTAEIIEATFVVARGE